MHGGEKAIGAVSAAVVASVVVVQLGDGSGKSGNDEGRKKGQLGHR